MELLEAPRHVSVSPCVSLRGLLSTSASGYLDMFQGGSKVRVLSEREPGRSCIAIYYCDIVIYNKKYVYNKKIYYNYVYIFNCFVMRPIKVSGIK